MPNTRVELPGDHWAELVDPMEVSNRELRPLKEAYAEYGKAIAVEQERVSLNQQAGDRAMTTPRAPQEGGRSPLPVAAQINVGSLVDAGEVFEDLAITFCVKAWDFEAEITPESVMDLPAPVHSAISRATAPIIEVWFPKGTGENTPIS